MNTLKISDKTKILIIVIIAIFEIGFINFNKNQPQIKESAIESQLVAESQPVAESKENPKIIEVDEKINTPLDKETKELAVHFMDVGQADAIYIGYGGFDMVIDGGNNEDGPYVVNYLQDKVTGPIEMVVGSHAHEDHIGGLDDVMKNYPIKMLIDSGEIKETKTYEDYMAAAKKSGAVVVEDATRHYDIDDQFTVDIIEAVDGESNTNNNSVIVKITYNQVSFLFTGDLEEEIESKILTKDLKATVFKAGHHGSSTSNSDMFMRRVQPEMIVISAGAHNKYGHPHAEALLRMQQHTNEIFGTWENGTIIVKTDGVNIQTDATEIVTMEDANPDSGVSESDTHQLHNKSKYNTQDSNWIKKLIKPSKKGTKKRIEDAMIDAVVDPVLEVVTEEVTNQVTEQIVNQKDKISEQENYKNKVIMIEVGE